MNDLRRLNSINALRGVSALCIVLFHSVGIHLNEDLENFHPTMRPLVFVASYSWMLGSSFLFVLSGYGISSYLNGLVRSGAPRTEFLRMRLGRIFPVYWAAFAVAIAVNFGAGIFNSTPLRESLPPSWSSLLANLFLVHGITGHGTYLLVAWAFAYIVYFYLLVGLVYSIRIRGLPFPFYLIPALAAAVISFFWSPAAGGSIWDSFWVTWPKFCIGALVYCGLMENSSGRPALAWTWVGAIALIGLCAHFGAGDFYTGFLAALGIMLFAIRPLDARLGRLPVVGVLQVIGLMSMSIFLIHGPIVQKVVNLADRWLDVSSPWHLLVQGVSIGAALAVSYLFFKGVEQPLNDLRRNRRWTTSGGGLTPPAPSLTT